MRAVNHGPVTSGYFLPVTTLDSCPRHTSQAPAHAFGEPLPRTVIANKFSSAESERRELIENIAVDINQLNFCLY
jgi:hypothetical protein